MAIYLDNASTTLKKPKEVLNVVNDIITSNNYGNPSRGAHDFSLNSLRLIDEVRNQVKSFLNASKNYEVAFTNSATTSLNMVLKGILSSGDHVITTFWEHNSVLRPLYQLKDSGVEIDFIGQIDENRELNFEELEKKIKPNTKAIVINHCSNVTGYVVDLNTIKKVCQRYNILLILDIAQTMGQYPIYLDDELVDVVCFAGHKSLYGLSGVGGVCLKNSLVEQISPIITGGDGNFSFDTQQPKVLPNLLEAGTANITGIASLGAGINFINNTGLTNIQSHILNLVDTFLNEVSRFENITLYKGYSIEKTGVVSMNIGNLDSSVISDSLWEEYQIATRSGYHCAPLAHKMLGTTDQGTVRFSFSYFNTLEEIEKTIIAINKISQRMM